MIEELLPPPVAAVEAFADPPVEPPLFPEEARVVERAVEKRRREFGTVRECARTALARLGGPRVPLLPGERGAPQWPAGFLGSMTHCAGYRAAAVARVGELASVGLDAEPNEPLPNEGVLEMVTLPAEREQLPKLAAQRPGVSFDRLFFSAKESVYKAWFPLTRRWLDFSEAELTITVSEDASGGAAEGVAGGAAEGGRGPGAAGTFAARLLVPGPVVDDVRLPGFDGRWLARDGLLVTAIHVPRQAPAAAPGGVAAGRKAAEGAAAAPD